MSSVVSFSSVWTVSATGDWKTQITRFLNRRAYRPATRETYGRILDKFAGWCTARGIQLTTVQDADLFDYAGELRSGALSESTVHQELLVLGTFFRWAEGNGAAVIGHADALASERPPAPAKEALTLEQLRHLWATASAPRDKIVVGLLAFAGLRPRELHDARVQDLGRAEGLDVLRIPGRAKLHDYPFAVLPPVLVEAIEEYLAGRTSGPLVLQRDGQAAGRGTVHRWLHRLARTAGMGDLHALQLTYSLRSNAIRLGFPYATVVRTVGEIEPRRLATWVHPSPTALEDHASLRLARLVTEASNNSLMNLLHAETMLKFSDAPPAVPAMYAAATLENHFRRISETRHLRVNSAAPKLGTYGALLKGQGILNASEIQTVQWIQVVRDNAAHGRFERVTSTDASETVRRARELVIAHPISEEQAGTTASVYLQGESDQQ